MLHMSVFDDKKVGLSKDRYTAMIVPLYHT